MKQHDSDYSLHVNPLCRPNRFVLAHMTRGTLSEKAERWLNARLENYGSEQFNKWRFACDIPPNTPNRLLTARQAWILSNHIRQVTEIGEDQP